MSGYKAVFGMSAILLVIPALLAVMAARAGQSPPVNSNEPTRQ